MGIEIFIRNPKGITLTRDGMEFLSYARQVVEQIDLLSERYKNPVGSRELFSVSSQHYAFVVEAFVSLLKKSDMENTSSSYGRRGLGRSSMTLRISEARLAYSF